LQDERKSYFKDLLQKKKQELVEDISVMDRNGIGEMDKYTPTELSNYDNHPADLGTDLFLTGMNYALKNHQKNQVYEVDEALKRISNGTYGICEDCGAEISEERLEVMPTANLCIKCQEDNTKNFKAMRRDRPVEEKVIGIPFSRKTSILHRDYPLEGMDQLNDVMKYGSADSPQDMGGYEDYEEYYTNELDRQGIVDPLDAISNEEYKRQLPG